MLERPGPKSRSAPSGAPSHHWPRGSAGLREAKPQNPEPTGKSLPQRRVLLTFSQGSDRCLWEKGTGVRMAPLPSPPAPGADSLLPTTIPHHQHHPPPPSTLPRPRASLTSHFDGHSLLGADEVDDLLMGARGDGVPIDPDDLVPHLGHTQREEAQVEGAPCGQAVHCQMPRACSPGKGTMA